MYTSVIVLIEATIILGVVRAVLREAHRQECRIGRDQQTLDLVGAVELGACIGRGIQEAIAAT